MNERFTEVPSGVRWYKDNETGLEWSETAPHKMDWNEAREWCRSVGGRLPSRVELLTLVDDSLHQPCTLLPHTVSGFYWSASTYAPNTNDAWFVNFFVGGVGALNKPTNGVSVRAVRGGCK